MAHSRKPPYRCKNLADISYTGRVIANFVSNFVAMATGVGRGKMQLTAFNSPSPKTPPIGVKISYASRVMAHFVPNFGQLQSKINKRGRSTLLVSGDFNVGGVDWDALTTKVNANNKGTCKRMLDIITDGGLSQLQKKPTCQGEVLDLLCTSNPSLLKSINTIPGISDHNGIVVADFYFQAFVNKRPLHNIPLWSRANWDAMKLSTSQFAEDFDRQFMSRSIDGKALKNT